jgi:hypothetical protein
MEYWSAGVMKKIQYSITPALQYSGYLLATHLFLPAIQNGSWDHSIN